VTANPPRILFITSESPHTAAAGAIVLHRLFRDYPTDRLLVVTNSLPPSDSARLGCEYRRLPLLADRAQRTRFWVWRNALSTLGAPHVMSLRRLQQTVNDFSPSVVVSLMQDSWYYMLAARYAHRARLPLLLLVHDLPHGFETVPNWLRKRQAARDAKVVRQAAARLFIGPGMREWFNQTVQLDGDVLLPPRSPHPVAHDPEMNRQLKRPGQLTLGYAGGLHYGYGEQLLQILPTLRSAGVRVEMFGPLPAGTVTTLRGAEDVFRFNGYKAMPEEAWRTIAERCDAVLQPYLNPPGAHALQYRTHFPSKLGDALALGLPLLITGPREAAGARWCGSQNAELAAIVSDPSPAALEATLHRLRDDGDWRVSLARNAQAAAHAFDPAPLQAKLLEHLQRINPASA
jgi:hypothetical protein